jgi:hypothetical protein
MFLVRSIGNEEFTYIICTNYNKIFAAFLKFQPIKNKNYSWQPCFMPDQDNNNIRMVGRTTDDECKVMAKAHMNRSVKNEDTR